MDINQAECADVPNTVYCLPCHVSADEGKEADLFLRGTGRAFDRSTCTLPGALSESIPADCQ